MKRSIVTAGVILLAAVPASMGLIGNASFAQSVPVRVPSQATVLDDNGGLTKHVEPGDDNGGLTKHVEPGDDKGGLTKHVEPGDDKGGLTKHVEPGDDKGGLRNSTSSGKNVARDSSPAKDDNGGQSGKDVNKVEDGPGHS
jgi:hypothetical protein